MPHVLSVGQCGFDHATITRFLRQAFQAEVVAADTFAEAIRALRAGTFALVLVNRVSDARGELGLELIRTLKADPELARIPVMLVSNFPAAQEQGQALGALAGFGKADMHSPASMERIEAALAPTPEPPRAAAT
jgi:two-component system, chemotaxis family, chemotaxis protein CheY